MLNFLVVVDLVFFLPVRLEAVQLLPETFSLLLGFEVCFFEVV